MKRLRILVDVPDDFDVNRGYYLFGNVASGPAYQVGSNDFASVEAVEPERYHEIVLRRRISPTTYPLDLTAGQGVSVHGPTIGSFSMEVVSFREVEEWPA